MKRMRYCGRCGRYTLKDACAACGGPTVLKVPPPYSNDEKLKGYRRESKREDISRPVG